MNALKMFSNLMAVATILLGAVMAHAKVTDFKVTITDRKSNKEIHSSSVPHDNYINFPRPSSQWECVARDFKAQDNNENMNLICCAKGTRPIACSQTEVSVSKGQTTCGKLRLREGKVPEGSDVEVALCGTVKGI